MWFSGFFFSYFVSHSWGIPMMKITGLSHLFKWENLHNWWLTKYFFAPLYFICKYSEEDCSSRGELADVIKYYRTCVVPSEGAHTPESNLWSLNYWGCKSEICILGIEKHAFFQAISVEKRLMFHRTNHCLGCIGYVYVGWIYQNRGETTDL